MHENKFEKQVQEKLDQFGFDPPEVVWAGVDKEINEDKKRRKPLFWIFFLSGLLLAGSGYFFLSGKHRPAPPVAAAQHSVKNEKEEKQAGTKDAVKNPRGLNENAVKKENAIPKAVVFRNIRKGKSNSNPGIDQENISVNANTEKAGKNGMAENNQTDKQSAVSEMGGVALNNGAKPTGVKNDSAITAVAPLESKSVRKDSVSTVKTVKENKKSPGWNYGFTGSVGLSDNKESLFASSQNVYGNYLSANPATGAGVPAGYGLPSNPTADFSFSAGVFINRSLSNRVSISAGLNYHYYSTTIHTSDFVDSTINVTNASSGLYDTRGFYRTGIKQSYTNQYHFIELPVSVNFQLNKSLKNPILWEAGFSLSYLLASNALQYDAGSYVYYKNNELFNRTQFNLETALLFGFDMQKVRVRVGPQLQYGLTPVLKIGANSPQHLIFYGMKLSFPVGKK